MTLFIRGKTKITHIKKHGRIEVTYSQLKFLQYKKLVMDIDGNIIKNKGFNSSDVDFYRRFTLENKRAITMESNGEI